MRHPVLSLLALAVLSACVEVTEDTVTTISPTAADRASPAYRACVNAIAGKTGTRTSDVAVFNYLYSEAGTRVEATVAGAQAPWSCLAANDGTVEEVMYSGSEGSL